MTQQLDDLTLGGAATLSTAGYFQRMHIGQQASDFNVADGTDDLGVKGKSEFVGVMYPYGGINTEGAAQDHLMITGQANAYRLRGNSGGSVKSFLRCNTTDTYIETEVELRTSKTYGWTNDAGGGEAIRQPESFDLGALADGEGAGEVLDVVNPMAVAGYLWLHLDLSTAASNACTLDAGIGTTGIVHDTVLDGLDANTAAGEYSSWDDTDRGTNGVAGVQIGATDYITISKKTGAASGLAGTARAWIMPLT